MKKADWAVNIDDWLEAGRKALESGKGPQPNVHRLEFDARLQPQRTKALP